ncbi:MAG TPA: alpha/beta hydrolase-fold protein [Verrucomicrobiota bacterium]|nr:alpha/beta hydrolase-fold protein [Verrucomicrobiota bacterium]
MTTPPNRHLSFLSLFLLAILPAAAQTPAPPATAEGRPTRNFGFGPPPVQSPEVSADKRITFRLRAPNATNVVVRGITRQSLPMQKGTEGLWTATTEALQPDLYAYSFVVDGLSMVDPSNTRFRPSHHRVAQSSVLVPGDMPWTPLPNAPRGAVTRHIFQSKIANDERDFFVYTPPNYDPKRTQPYPVLILQHGLYDEANAWIEVGAANVILDTLINQGKAVPMIMVNPLGYGTANGPADIDREGMLPAYIRTLLEEVMPQVERQYNVSTEPKGRAIAGLSMGGGQAMLAGLNHLDKFAWLGSFSGAFNNWPETRPVRSTATPGLGAGGGGRGPGLTLVEARLPIVFPNLDAKANSQIKLLWIACGTSDGLIGVNRQFKAYLDSKGVNATFKEIPDMGHVWPLWRQNLADFAPLLFK